MSDIEFVTEALNIFLKADEVNQIKILELLESAINHPEHLAELLKQD